jgi:catalase (peroxidase I)
MNVLMGTNRTTLEQKMFDMNKRLEKLEAVMDKSGVKYVNYKSADTNGNVTLYAKDIRYTFLDKNLT